MLDRHDSPSFHDPISLGPLNLAIYVRALFQQKTIQLYITSYIYSLFRNFLPHTYMYTQDLNWYTYEENTG